MEPTATLVTIGEFARLTRLSPKALRLYADLDLLTPAHVDPTTGYRRYALAQLDRAHLVATLRRVGLPLARVQTVLSLDSVDAAAEIRAYWAEAESTHAARRALITHLLGEDPTVPEITVHDIPTRTLLGMIRRVREEDLVPTGRELLIHRLRRGGVPRLEGVAGAPFTIYHGEVSPDSDGPVEWCWPVPDIAAPELATRFPDLTLRTEPAHQEAFVRLDPAGDSGPHTELALRALAGWAADHHREPAGAIRLVLVPKPVSTGDGPDGHFAVPLR
jgi:DNA-binding transcriptional MerR regulator